MKGNHFWSEQVIAIRNALWDVDDLLPRVADDGVCPPIPIVVALLHDLEPVNLISTGVSIVRALSGYSYQPLPTPESLVASVTFFMYAMTGP